ncbi:MAG: hypothetical protein QXG03_04825 [Halalkalicoccus sp.]
MSDEPTVGRRNRSTEPTASAASGTDGSSMRARAWAIAYRFYAPEDYGIATLPDWDVRRDEGGMALAEDENEAPFLRAERPMRVRR